MNLKFHSDISNSATTHQLKSRWHFVQVASAGMWYFLDCLQSLEAKLSLKSSSTPGPSKIRQPMPQEERKKHARKNSPGVSRLNVRVSYAGSRTDVWTTFPDSLFQKWDPERPYLHIFLLFWSHGSPSNLVGKDFLCGRSWPQLHSMISWTIFHERDFKGFFLEERPWKNFSIQCSNSGINENTPQTQSNVSWTSSKAELEISFLNSDLEISPWKSGPKIGPATGIFFQYGLSRLNQVLFWKIRSEPAQSELLNPTKESVWIWRQTPKCPFWHRQTPWHAQNAEFARKWLS